MFQNNGKYSSVPDYWGVPRDPQDQEAHLEVHPVDHLPVLDHLEPADRADLAVLGGQHYCWLQGVALGPLL